jgi:predicted dehydrogenase
MNRRQFFTRTAGGIAALSVSRLAAASRGPGINQRIRLGFMGVGGRAGSLLGGFAALDDVDVAALYDVDQRRIARAVNTVAERAGGRKPRVVSDFRALMDDGTIDAVVVGTPDHWHAPGTLHACLAGKDVYVEKPISHNIHEGRLMVETARTHKRVVQVGIQSRSSAHHDEAYAYIRSGKLGKVSFVRAWESAKQRNLGFPPDSPVPEGVDYDTWLGPAPKRPFNRLRFHGSWRWFFAYGAGDLGNDGVHRLDYAIRGLNAAREAQGLEPVTFPRAVAASGGKYCFNDAQEWPDTQYVTYDYPSATLVYEMRIWSPYPLEGESEGAAVYGENGFVVIGNRSWRAFGPGGKPTGDGGPGDWSGADRAHKRNFLDCMHSRKRPSCDIEVGQVASVLCHAGNVAWRVNRKLVFDAATQTFTGDREANALVTRTYRKGFELPV